MLDARLESNFGQRLFAERRQADTFRAAFVEGMSAPEKSIPCRFLYDAEGSALFERICATPEYYLTRAETEILRRHAADLAHMIGEGATLIELGSGASVKTRLLLDHMKRPSAYVPVDICAPQLTAAGDAIAGDYPGLDVAPVCADYAAAFILPAGVGRRVIFFPGSTIGNLDVDEAERLLHAWRRRIGSSGLFIVGVDLRKDPGVLEAAYDDDAGVTRAFIKNVLARANRELDGDFNLERFDYEARFIDERSRVEMRLISRIRQVACAAGGSWTFARGEPIHVENSHKYAPEAFEALATRAGFRTAERLTDSRGLFSVYVLAPPDGPGFRALTSTRMRPTSARVVSWPPPVSMT
jgi:dimethylhistidine N-methyltransferase